MFILLGLALVGSVVNADQSDMPQRHLGLDTKSDVSPAPFADGECVCFLGDSITAGGYYQTILSNYYLTRFPDRKVRFVNAGRSGDSAGGALKRLKEDVVDKHPTTVVIMFGMNDVYRHTYTANPTKDQLKQQQVALDRFEENMNQLVKRLREEADDPKLVFLTPTPFDQTVVLDRENNQPGCNDGLGRCAAIVREIAHENGASLIDLHTPMTEFNLERQRKDPTWTIVGPDRVHPGNEGRLMMSWLILKAQCVHPVVSNVAIDAATGELLEFDNAVASNLAATSTGITFTLQENALPLPIESSLASLVEHLPIVKDLNQQRLSVRGLTPGDYELRIDGHPIGRHSTEALEQGINIALYKNTPQYRQAVRVTELNSKRREAEAMAGSLLNTRRWMISHYKLDVDDPDALQAHYERFDDKRQYNANMAKRYIENWHRYDEIRQEVIHYEQAIEPHRVPVPHEYELRRVVSN
ncbi:SGNH/GDSL hydrolase family protein [Rhodopirellula sp. SWK7]|uniref:SGNH/GDSL hydrolase family protein n=1 Tax=Rhodopirellula sp. SWK7 TaxID=595460 RepID=UPI0002BD7404|nr:SGNH/GDSL hydrolase family protein [Rhodopirellula sp. SWK7]EMI42340.1 lipolytic enzyme, G-D-S-L [Rhodopirellula sp. SWK7]